LLLDTQVALWWLTGHRRLPSATRARLGRSACAVSVVSLWEVDIKHELGKLPVSVAQVREKVVATGATVLPLTEDHVLATLTLPRPHADPFDRLLLRVARHERLVLLTADQALVDLRTHDASLPIEGV
jgi:PIN domain nuclease of toxin-antitoxin system